MIQWTIETWNCWKSAAKTAFADPDSHRRNARRAGERDGDAERAAGHHQHRRQRDDERRQLGPDHDQAVGEADQAGDDEGEDDADPRIERIIAGADRHHHRRRADHRADRQVELAADHQHPDREGDDAEIGGGVEPVGGAEGGEEAVLAGGDGEEGEDQDRRDDPARFGTNQQAAEPSARRAGDRFFVGRRERRGAGGVVGVGVSEHIPDLAPPAAAGGAAGTAPPILTWIRSRSDRCRTP